MARSKARSAKAAPARASAVKKKAAKKAARKSAAKTGVKAAAKRGAKSAKPRAKPATVAWVTVPDPAQPNDRLRVAVPARSARPDADRDEAAYTAEVLHENRQISRSGAMRPGETHAVEETASGQRQLVRKRFSTI